MLRTILGALTANAVSLLGTVIAGISLLLIVMLFVLMLFGYEGGPYIGILTFLILPALTVLGAVLIPLGIWLQRRRDRRAADKGESPRGLPVIDLNSSRTRGLLVTALLIAVAGVLVIGGATYKGVEYMESSEFCGEACHRVMQPEYTAYQRSPHAQVECADCHIGPGAEWFVKSKLSGSWQLVAVMFDLYPRPIPSPVHNLRPARDTCEQCHWTQKFVGDSLRISTHYEEDEANTELKSAVLLKVGGQQGRDSHGIHWHVDPGNRIRYLSDASRETIYDVELAQADGTVKVYRKGDAPEGAEWREMDCVDCHNRPTHIYGMPDEEVDLAIVEGRIDHGLPYVKREAVRILGVEYESHTAARAGIAHDLDAFYRENYAERHEELAPAIQAAAQALGDIYSWNVFPHMKVTWGTYPDHIGHQDDGGCFRCHDKRHRTEDRERIDKDCDTCHAVLAEREENPEILEQILNP